MSNSTPTVHRLAIFASGTGSNAERLIAEVSQHDTIQIAVVIVSHADALIIKIAQKYNILVELLDKNNWRDANNILQTLQQYDVSFVVLAGFLWRVPLAMVQQYPNHIINLHPSLLPKFGGKGMYGMHVHRAVVEAGEQESGITIHYVNEYYDEGAIIAQFSCAITPEDTPENVSEKVRNLEKIHFVPTVMEILTKV